MEKTFYSFDIDTPSFSLNGLNSYARIVNIIDGDTVSLVIPIFNNYFKFNIRIKGIDTCEIHSSDPLIKEHGIKAKQKVCDIILKKKLDNKKDIIEYLKNNIILVWIECLEFDKYGRLLAEIYTKDKTQIISKCLLDEKLAYLYEGDTKKSNDELKEYFNL
jgi:endonuclease YncB( thermonuclease family)